MYNFIKFILATLFILSFSFCNKFKKKEKTKEELPPATQEGKNTFGCLIDGKVWLPKNYGAPNWLGGSLDLLNFSYYNKKIDVSAKQITKEGNYRSINIYSKNIKQLGVYKLYVNVERGTNSNSTAYTYREANNPSESIFFINDTVSSSLIVTKLDTINKIISGNFRFNFTLSNQNVEVKDGVFDLNYK